jgi:uncharacterized protein (DUF1800 family)
MIPDQTIEQPISLSLSPYTGQWTEVEAAHLLRRTMFGPTLNQIRAAVTNGLSATVSSLLTIPTITPPLTTSSDESVATFGQTWVNSVYPAGDTQPTENARLSSMASWLMQNINKEQLSIAEKICLFWQNHFAAEASFDSRATYHYFNLIRTYAIGDFKQLIKEMTSDPNMLFFLNGVSNQSFSPNENYARELLELYTIGKGPQVGEGDYTNYTEQDVAAGAKILTGWTVDGMRSTSITKPVAVFNSIFHSPTTKQLSSRFGNASITNGGAQEYENYIDVIFQQPAVATFICTKLYRYFVNYDITQEVQDNVISQMANTLITNNYVIEPVLEELFSSDHFYDVSIRGAIIKNPLELIFSILNSTSSQPTADLATNYQMYLTPYWVAGNLGQSYAAPPNVGGWPAYYQAPSFSKLWINSTFIKQRFEIGYYLTLHTGIEVNGNFFKANALQLLTEFINPSDPVEVINEMCLLYFPKGASSTEKATLKYILTNGLPDFEWTLQYNEYMSNMSDPTYSDPVRVRIESVMFQMFQMPEFQTI